MVKGVLASEQRSSGSGLGLRDLLENNRRRATIQALIAVTEGIVEASILALFASAAVGTVLDVEQDAGLVFGYVSSPTQAIFAALFGVGLRFFLGTCSSLVTTSIQREIILRLRQRSISAYSSSGWLEQMRTSEGALQQLVIDLPTKASSTALSLLKNSSNLLTLVAMLVVSAVSNLFLTAVLLLGVVAISGIFVPLRRAIKKRSAKVLSRQKLLSTHVAEMSAAKVELNALRVKAEATKPMFRLLEAETRLSRWVQFLKGMVEPIYVGLTYTGIALGLLLIGPVSDSSLGSAGSTFLIVLRSLSYGQSLQTIGVTLAAFHPISAAFTSEVSRLESSSEVWGATEKRRFSEIHLNTTQVTYGEGREIVLASTSLKLRPGERVGVVGPSGSGKTSLCRAILGLLPVEDEALMVDGIPVRDLSESTWRSFVGFVPQNPSVIRGSIRSNLIFFRKSQEDAELWRALRLANLADEVMALGDGLDTILGAGFHEFSGGQRQRLGIARALIGNPQLLIMDEPTSSVDFQSERAIVSAIRELPEELCLVIVTHRKEIISDCGRIIVVENGRITSDGERSEVGRSNDFAQSLLRG